VTSVIWSPQSVRDLEAIHAYISDESVRYADLVVGRLVAAVERLQAFPESGRMVPERADPSIREIIVGSYRVVYRRSPDLVEIATVFRGSRLFPELG
jgi:addiction module toxin, RelE/StbE family